MSTAADLMGTRVTKNVNSRANSKNVCEVVDGNLGSTSNWSMGHPRLIIFCIFLSVLKLYGGVDFK